MPYFKTEDNTKLYYEEKGSGSTLLFLHGWSGSTKRFEKIIDVLSKSYHCIAYDHRGHGASSLPQGGVTIRQLAKDCHELIEFLGLEDIILIGHSMGGATILSYAEQFGCQHIKKMIIMDTTPKFINDENWDKGIYGSIEDFLKDMDTMYQNMGTAMLESQKRDDPTLHQLPQSVQEIYAQGLMANNHSLLLAGFWYALGFADLRGGLDKIVVPTAIFHPLPGEKFLLYPPKITPYMLEKIPAPTKEVGFPNTSHMFILQVPEQVAQQIQIFIEQSEIVSN